MNTEEIKLKLDAFINAKWVELTIAALILLSVFLVFYEASVKNPGIFIIQLNDAITLLFVFELSIRFYVAPKKSLTIMWEV